MAAAAAAMAVAAAAALGVNVYLVDRSESLISQMTMDLLPFT